MQSIPSEVVEKLYNPIEKYISDLADTPGYELTTRPIFSIGEDGSIEEKEYPYPHQVTKTFYDDTKPEYITETAEWMFETAALNNDDYVTADLYENLIEAYERDLVHLSARVIEYSLDFEFDETSFHTAIHGDFAREFGARVWQGALAPLYNFTCDETTISLNNNLQITKFFDNASLESVSIKEPSNEELASIYTSQGKSPDIPYREEYKYIIRAEGQAVWGEGLFDAILDSLITALRLFQPEQFVDKRDVVYVQRGPLFENEGIYDWYGVKPSDDRGRSFRPDYNMEASHQFVNFWQQYRNDIQIGDDRVHEELLSRPLRRLNNMYEKSASEDMIIDAVIGFEGTLTKDGGRLADRGVVLLEESQTNSSFIYRFLEQLWGIRNSIVHQDEDLQQIEINGEVLTPEEITTQARQMLANTIVGYFDLLSQNPELNITQINQHIIKQRIIDRLSGK